MLEYITAACSVGLLFGATTKNHSEKWITHTSLWCSTLSFFLIFSLPVSFSLAHIHFHFIFSAPRLIPSPVSVVFYFLPIYNSLARMFHISHLPFSRSSVSLQLSSLFFFQFNSTLSLFSLHLSLLMLTLLLSSCFFYWLLFLPSWFPLLSYILLLFSSHPSISPTLHPSLHPWLFTSPATLHSPRLFFLFLFLSLDTNRTHGLLISESNRQTYNQCMDHEAALKGFETPIQLCTGIQDSMCSVHTPKSCIEYLDCARMINTAGLWWVERGGEKTGGRMCL